MGFFFHIFIYENNNYKINQFRTELGLYLPDVPIFSPAKSRVTSKSNQYMKFTFSDMEKDASQSTVPFIDTQPVTANVPLSGVGIYHKGRRGFGGFFAPNIITYDFKRHIRLPE